MIGTVALTADPNTVLVAMHRTIVTLDVRAKSFGKPLLEVPEDHGVDSMRFNDGKGSPGGAFIVGRMHSKWRDGEPGRLYRADVKIGKLEELLGPEEVGLPNGMAWDTARHTMYFVDTYAGTVTAYGTDEAGVPVKGANGKLQARCVVKVPKEDGIPDGMTIDRDGNLWVALAEGGALGCYDPDTGDLKRKVQLPVKKPLACTFGGPDLDQLFVTTRVEKGEGASEHWGSILSVRVPGVKGVDGGYQVST
ncbi:g5036 [Coccomyxa elongata]